VIRACRRTNWPTTALLGDFILSRMNAPLVSTAMTLLRAGKRARVAGKDIGDDLIKLVRGSARAPAACQSSWSAFRAGRGRSPAPERRPQRRGDRTHDRRILDQADMLQNLADDARNVGEIEDRIEALFTDDGLGQAGVITLSSVHKAKGLEADRVFILAETLKNHTREEENIRYVAITRAKQELVWVGNLAPGQVPDTEPRRNM
jgi:DNA helicase-2/ATP-dependent DNA helicase PcrA